MARIARLLKHRLWDERDAHRALPSVALARLQAQVTASEAQHSGEIRVCVEASLPLHDLWRSASPRARAVALFGELRVWDTEHNNGVLIYLLLAERRIEVVADRGLSRQVADAHWLATVSGMSDAFKNARFEAGLSAAVDAVSALLVKHFPLAPGATRANELPDAPTLL